VFEKTRVLIFQIAIGLLDITGSDKIHVSLHSIC
jgi:hypothetical protein